MTDYLNNTELNKEDKEFRKKVFFDVQDLKKLDDDSFAIKRYEEAVGRKKTVNQSTMFPELVKDNSVASEDEED